VLPKDDCKKYELFKLWIVKKKVKKY